MKYSKIAILLLLLSGCQEAYETRSRPLIPNIPRYHECNQLLSLGYDIDGDACVRHVENPKYKIGQSVKIISNTYYVGCRFLITRPAWAHGNVMNKPSYVGRIECREGNNTVYSTNDSHELESNLRISNK